VSEGPYEGPVIFYPRVVRQEDRVKAKSLNAPITRVPEEFLEFVSTVAEAQRPQAFAQKYYQTAAQQFRSSLKEKMFSSLETEKQASILLERMSPEQATEELIRRGVGKVMAESAVQSANSLKNIV
jgi:hypothetical protein